MYKWYIISGIEKLQFVHERIIHILYLEVTKCFYKSFINIAKFYEKLPVVLVTLKIFVKGVKGVSTLPFPHLLTKGMVD